MATEYTLAAPNAVPAACTYLETIGRTPMVRLSARSLPPDVLANDVTVLCKLELQNPGGSLKDRIALNMIEAAEARGELRPGMTIVSCGRSHARMHIETTLGAPVPRASRGPA
jgi:hypothetical protein